MTSYLQEIVNENEQTVHLAVLMPGESRSYDVVLGQGERLEYDSLYNPSSVAVPAPKSAAAFLTQRLVVDVGYSRYSIYEYDSTLRIAPGDSFSTDAPLLAGFHGPGAFGIKVPAGAQPIGYKNAFLAEPYVASVSWDGWQYGIYGVSEAGDLMAKSYRNAWLPWRNLSQPPPGLAGPVTAATWYSGQYSVLVAGKDHQIYGRSHGVHGKTNPWWGPWSEPLAGDASPITGLAAATYSLHNFSLYMVTADQQLLARKWQSGEWAEWEPLGRPPGTGLAGPVAAVGQRLNRQQVFALGNDGKLWNRSWDSGVYSGWKAIAMPAPLRSITANFYEFTSVYGIAGVDDSGCLWSQLFDGSVGKGWTNLQKPADASLAGPVTFTTYAQVLPVFGDYAYYALGDDQDIYQLWRGTWSPLNGS